MDVLALTGFLVSATALLGSPGPGIAALIVVGRSRGWRGGLRYYAGLQIGLAAAAAITAAGLFSLLSAFPAAIHVMTIVAAVYLLYLALKVATAPVGAAFIARPGASSAIAGAFLGITNPKAYVVFASLFASRTVLQSRPESDALLKWALCVLVIVVVDLAWLFVGVALKRASLAPRADRVLNVSLGVTILAAAALTFA